MKGGLDLLRKVLTILPVVQANQGIRVADLARRTGIPAREIVSDLPKLVNLCGVPPYSPADLVDLEIEGDRVTIRFAEQFRRPVRLTLGEALALDMALAGLEAERRGPFSRAVEGVRGKVREALGEEFSGAEARITAVSGPGRAAERVARLKWALERQVEVFVEYFSHSSGALSERRFRPWGIYDRGGHYYVVGWADPPGHEVTLRADRVKGVRAGTEEYEIPDEFVVGEHRLEGPPDPAAGAVEVKVRFAPEQSRFARDRFPASGFEEQPDGAVVATVRTVGTYWLVSELLRWGGAAEVLCPEGIRELVQKTAGAALGRYGRRK